MSQIDTFTNQKFRFYSFFSMFLLVFVHGYNLNTRYLQPFTVVDEPLTVTTFLEYFLVNGIFRFRVPILFIISGYLFALRDDRPYGERILRRVRTLFVPYVLWSFVGILVTFGMEHWQATRMAVLQTQIGPFADKSILDYSFGEWMFKLIISPLPFQLWFIRCLLIYNIIYPWLKSAVLRFPKITFTITGLLWLVSYNLWLIEGEGLLFFTLGVWMSKTNFDICKPPKWLRINLIGPAWIAIAAVKTWLAFQSQISVEILAPTLTIMYKFVVLSVMITLWYGADALVKFFMSRKWFVYLSAFSFIIYAFHAPLINYGINLASSLLVGIPAFRILLFFLLPLSVIAVCIAVGVTLRSLAPKVYGIFTGGRGLR